ncbi:MAG: DUF378 domain-containing protein [Chlamydiae bacterium RIFCSPHIGHO2_12_FULL_49_9]|nr:MAG: DUF378 domain-containing protein [Chlamydiae bacterium RIFCSPHIGHO2_12_FULL_49_9]
MMTKHSHLIDMVAVILLLIGGLNWGLVGLFGFDLVGSMFGEMSAFSRIIYVLVGLAAIWRIVCWVKCKK